MQNSIKKITIYVDDNFHYMDESERYEAGKFATKEEALAVCKKIVDDYLLSAFEPGMSKKNLYESYLCFGDDPWFHGCHPEYSSWKYAQTRCGEICAPAKSVPLPQENLDTTTPVSTKTSSSNKIRQASPELNKALQERMDLALLQPPTTPMQIDPLSIDDQAQAEQNLALGLAQDKPNRVTRPGVISPEVNKVLQEWIRFAHSQPPTSTKH